MSGGPLPPAGHAPPELGPLLGPLLAPPHGSAAWLDEIRLALLGELFAAAGRARHNSNPQAGLAEDVWLEVFRRAADRAATRVVEDIDRGLAAAAAASRMPRRLSLARRLSEEDRRVIGNRLQSAAIPLERMLEHPAGGQDPDLRHIAAALLAAWDRLVTFAADEQQRGARQAAEARAWRRPRGPLWGISAGLLLLALATGLMLGGFLPAPGPLARLRDWWWRLPWP